MSEGGFEIAQAHLTVTAQGDDASVEQTTSSMGSRLTKWAAGLGIGALITKGITDNLDISQANTKLKAQMGLTSGEAEKAGKIAGTVYRDNFGESMDEVNESIKAVGNNFGDLGELAPEQIKGISEAALGLSSVFGVDVAESTKSAAQLVKNGLAKDSTEAFDIITKGFQSGANTADDFLETINEYSPQFDKLGLTGKQAMGLLSQGMQAGARDTDTVADAFKEFSLRAIDGSTQTAQGFKMIGLNAQQTAKDIAAGGPAAADALEQTILGLQGMQDPIKQNAAGVALFGTQWEDTLRQILPSIDLTTAAQTDVAGATKAMNDEMGNTPTAKVEAFKRQMEGVLQNAMDLPGPMGTAATGLASLGPAGITAAAGVVSIATQIGPMVASIGTFVAAQATAAASMVGTAATAVATTATTVATTVAGWVTQAATAVASAATIAAAWLVAYWPVALIVAAVVALVVVIVKNWDTISRVTTELWTSVWNFTKAIWDTIMKGIKAAIDFVVYLFLNWTIYGQVIKHWQDIYDFITMILTGIKNGVKAALDWINSTASSVTGKIASTFTGAWSRIAGIFTSGKNAVTGIARDAMNGVVNSITGKVSAAFNAAGRVKSAVTGVFANLGSTLYNAGRNLIGGFVSGIVSKIGSVKDTLGGLTSKLTSWKGPEDTDRTILRPAGRMVIGGFVDGLEDQVPAVRGTLQGLTAQLPSMTVPAVAAVPAAAGGPQITLNVNWSSFFIPTHDQLRELFATVAADLNEALRKYNKQRAGVATS